MKDKSRSTVVGLSPGLEQNSNGFPGPKHSQPSAMHLDTAAAGDTWMSDGLSLAQDVAVALQQGASDIEPTSDAPSYEALCSRSQQTCQQLAASSSAPSCLSQQQLLGLQQICSSVMQLATALLCDASVAVQLIAAGSYTAAADQVKGSIKQVCGYLLECLRAAATGVDDPANQQQQHGLLQHLLPAVQATVQQLLDIGLTQAAFIAQSQPPHRPITNTQVPKELRSMAVLNLSWGNLCKLLLETPTEARAFILQHEELNQALQCSLQQLKQAVKGSQAPEKREVLARFWLQNAQRFVTVASSAAISTAATVMELIVEAAVEAYAFSQRDDIDIHPFLEQQLQPRLTTCLSVLLSSSPEDPAATQAKLDCLTNTSTHTVHDRSNRDQDPQQQQQQQQMQAHLLAVLDLMQHLPTMPAATVQQCCQQLLLWVIRTAGSTMCSSILSQGPSGAALLQHVLQCCLMCCVGCAELLQPHQQQELLAGLIMLALDTHPLVSFIAQQLLAEVLSCSSSEAVQQQLVGLFELLESAAACCAVPGCGEAAATAATAADRVIGTIAAILQAQEDGIASGWVGQLILNADPINSSSNSWLDPSSCSLLSHQCSLLLQLQPSGGPVNQAQLEECLNQLWLTAQQVLELLDIPHWQQQQQSSLSGPAASEQLLVLHQLTWQLEAMQGLMLLLTAKHADQQVSGKHGASGQDSQGASSLVQGCTSFALEVLKVITCPSRPASSDSISSRNSPAAAMHTACTAAALKVLAAAAHIAVPSDTVDQLLQIMQAVAKQQEGLHYLLAAVVGKVRISGENTRHEELFQLLLSSPYWPVRHAALASLISHLQYNNFAKTGIPKLLPGSMKVSPTEAKPEAIDVIKGYLHKRPDSQAQAAYERDCQQLLDHHSHNLTAASSPTSGGCSGSSTWSWRCIAAELSQLEELVAAGNLQAGVVGAVRSGGSDWSAALHTLMQLATTAGASLEAVEQALFKAESEVQQLMSAATTAAQGQQLSSDEVMVISRKGSSMVGSCASLCSRLRALQDKLSCLKS